MKSRLLYIGNKLSLKGKTVSGIETLGKSLEWEGYRVNYSSTYKNKVLRLLNMCFSVILFSKKVDYVLIDTYSTFNFYYAFLTSQLCRIFKLPYVIILRGGNLPNRLKNNPKLSRAIFKNAYLNVAPSEYTKSAFQEFGFNNVECIPNSIDIKKYKFISRHIDEIKLLWVRSFSEIYNPKLAVDIAFQLKAIGHEVLLTMVGPEKDGTLKQTKQYAQQKNISVTFTGKLNKEEWINLSKDYNIFINTTNFDNMPVSVIEAMALGLPVISTNVGGIPYLISNNEDGLLVPPNSVDDFVKQILKFKYDEHFCKHITVKAREKVEQFDWNVVKDKWMKVLK